MRKKTIVERIIVILAGLFLCLILLELGLRIAGFAFFSLQERQNLASIKQKGTYRIMCL